MLNAGLHDMTDELLMKFLLAETTEGETISVEKWLAADVANEKYMKHLKLIWETSKHLEAKSGVDENMAWDRFKAIADGKAPLKIKRETPVKTMNLAWLRIAAAVIIIIGGAWTAYFYFKTPTGGNYANVELKTQTTVRTDTLPDGSVVTLNKNSRLSYAAKFRGKQREIKLQQGEAFFNVAANKSKPFVIKVNDVTITVLGTSFNVKSNNGTTEVIVATGEVKVERSKNSVQLKSHEKIEIKEADIELLKEANNSELYNYYSTQKLVANDTPLWQVVDVLNATYGTRIVIGREELRNLPLNTTFDHQPLDSILKITCETFKLKTVKKDNLIIIK